jgi:alkanesulfonate monooxygenase SsuD/methylene tetrahydromethanopterin reductase-like flavin-dependent oxidoreductase (luciferase family)
MRTGIGLPAAVPGADMTQIGRYAAAAEEVGFASVGVIDRLVYDNLEPLIALAAAAAATSRIHLTSTVINVNWRANPVLLAKQLASVALLSGGRFTAGLGMGGWPTDYKASGVPLAGRGPALDAALADMNRAWADGKGRPEVVLGGLAPGAIRRAATPVSAGWVAPLMDIEVLRQGSIAVRDAWARAGRQGSPRVITGRYFSLGTTADVTADEYIRHYYGPDYFPLARPDTLTSAEQIHAALAQLSEAGCTDVVLYPCSGGLAQIELLGEVLTGQLAVGPGTASMAAGGSR